MTDNSRPRKLELLAPARDAETAIAAIEHGADAVYMGAGSHGARASASNSIAEIARVAEVAHRYNAKVYVTVNTIVYDEELKDVERLVNDLYHAGADALIVQDMSLLRMKLPPIALHASTQCDTRTPEKARQLARSGFTRIVLARELSLREIKEIAEAVEGTDIEVFVHGAVCVSYSGDCQAGFDAMGRSANRGECPQMCRLPYDLKDGDGKRVMTGKHLLSMRDMNRMEQIGEMADAGVMSFKIEGRLKDANYVKNVTAAYRQALDRVIEASDGRYERASAGKSHYDFRPDPDKSFNRGYMTYFLDNVRPGKGQMATLDTPKWVGQEIGEVARADARSITLKACHEMLTNGDGVGFFAPDGSLAGVRVNRVEGNKIVAGQRLEVIPRAGTKLYRNRDKARDDEMDRSRCRRQIGIEMTLRLTQSDVLVLDITDAERGNAVTATLALDKTPDDAQKPQVEARRRVLEKLGETIYEAKGVDDRVGMKFIPASVLTQLRRRGTEMLDAAQRMTSERERPGREEDDIEELKGRRLTRHDNVANRLAEEFYASHGAETSERALEVERTLNKDDRRVMECRYCLRRELGACLKTPEGRRLKGPLRIQATGRDLEYELRFDCDRCRMTVWRVGG